MKKEDGRDPRDQKERKYQFKKRLNDSTNQFSYFWLSRGVVIVICK